MQTTKNGWDDSYQNSNLNTYLKFNKNEKNNSAPFTLPFNPVLCAKSNRTDQCHRNREN